MGWDEVLKLRELSGNNSGFLGRFPMASLKDPEGFVVGEGIFLEEVGELGGLWIDPFLEGLWGKDFECETLNGWTV